MISIRKRLPQSAEWNYVLATLAAFVFLPELRRLIDWHGNYDPLNVFAAIPLFMLCPIAIMAFKRRKRLHSGAFAFVMLTWALAFTYSTFVAIAHGAVVQAIYADAQFCLPAVIGVWLLTRDEDAYLAHKRLASALLVFGTIAAVYGIFQYVVAPPWDTAWMLNVDGDSNFGTPERFGIRVFGVLNGPGIFALFLGSVILFSLPYVSVRNVAVMFAMFAILIALLLSLVRTAWLEVSIGVLVFICLSPKRSQAILTFISLALVGIVAVCVILFASPNRDTSDTLMRRFTTLSDVQEDASVKGRRATSDAAFQRGFENPVGAGLGVTGGSSKLGSSDASIFSGAPGLIDNGFASRFFEMGVPGMAGFLIACCASIAFVFRAFAQFRRGRNTQNMVVAASCIATQITIFGVNIAGDDQQGLIGALFFAALALALIPSNRKLPKNAIVPLTTLRYASYDKYMNAPGITS